MQYKRVNIYTCITVPIPLNKITLFTVDSVVYQLHILLLKRNLNSCANLQKRAPVFFDIFAGHVPFMLVMGESQMIKHILHVFST